MKLKRGMGGSRNGRGRNEKTETYKRVSKKRRRSEARRESAIIQQHRNTQMIAPSNNEPKFELGKIVATPGALTALEESGEAASSFIHRHHTGDWGDVCEDDAEANEEALQVALRIFSVYHSKAGVKLYVISEADRSSTTILLASDY